MFNKKTDTEKTEASRKQDVLVERDDKHDPKAKAKSHAEVEEFEHGNHPQKFQNTTNDSLADPANQPYTGKPDPNAANTQLEELQAKAQPVVIVPAPTVRDTEAERGEQEAQRRREEHEANLKRPAARAVHSSEQPQHAAMRNVNTGGGRTVKAAH
jgi:hypothetical protein